MAYLAGDAQQVSRVNKITRFPLQALDDCHGFIEASAGTGKTYTIDGRRIDIATVREGVFEDYIPLRAAVEPLKTVYLDAVEGGRVEQVLVEEGAVVTQGQPLVELSNTQLQLDLRVNVLAAAGLLHVGVVRLADLDLLGLADERNLALASDRIYRASGHRGQE